MKLAKKLGILSVIIIISGALIFAGCGEEADNGENGEGEENGQAESTDLQDGVYTASSEAGERSYTEATVTVDDGEITDVKLYEFDNRGLKKGVDFAYNMERWAEQSEDLPEEFEYFTDVTDELEQKFVEANSYEVDIISGATGSTESAMDAVERALGKAKGETGPYDGTFMGVSDEGSRSWGIAWVTLEDNEIVDVRLEEAGKPDAYEPAKKAELKDEDYDWDEFHEAKEELPEAFIEANSPDVDIITGATGSSEGWKQAVARALANAERYERVTGYSEYSRGFVKADIVLDGEEFVDVSLVEYDDQGRRKEIDYQYDVENWADNRDDYPEEYESLQEMHDDLIARFMDANSAEIDTITGATSTSEKAQDAVEKALTEGAFDGTFMGLSSVNERGGWNIAFVTFENSEITEVELEEIQKTDDGDYEMKDEDYDWDEFHEAKEDLPEMFIEAEEPTEVDNITGATGSVDRWKEAVKDAMEKADIN
ncbi:FMN-binding protein [Natranaerobius thermophilus]|uniref:FMN-binding domain protein n=1 Tax=Natranaerobius thermophilus (strain ATCC BAA-1301 / DSM 18059 / JW/NM-WN-LF) TaxID=457570 RepID=B2A6Y2_NATTJ|nr:FMN-binding protein [Natranaerobius thermophilus]ACB85573.1 FMN-binding domain protein [Natranaerobius thermophilus JW/NM-WN-LF]